MLGMMTAITEVTRNASTASRGLNMISSRLVQVLDESSSTGKKLTKIYADLGIALKDDTGQMRSTYDILKDLAGQWNTLSGDQQKYIALTSAGARQTQNFVALMENFDTAIRATSTAYNSAGSAAKENERVLDSISKKIEILHSEFQQLVIGDGGLQEFAKAILDIGITLLKFANSDIGKAIITFGLLEVAILSARRALLTLGQTNVVVSAITSLIAGEATLTQVTNFLTEAIIRNTRAFITSPLFLGSVALAGIVALGYAMKNYAEQLETATKNIKDLKDQAESTNSELSSTKTQLEQIHEQIKKNNELKLKLTNYAEINTLEKETSELEKQESALKRQVELLELKLELENKAAEEAAKETYNKKGASNINNPSFLEGLKNMALNPYGVESRVEATTTMVTPAEEMDLAIKKIEELTKKKEELFRASIEELKTNGELSDTYKKQKQEIADLDKEINDAQQAGQKAEDTLETILGSLKSNSKETVELRDKINSQLGSWLDVNKEVNQVVDAYNRLKELSKGGAVDLTIRPIVDDSEMVKAGYKELLGSNSYSTTYSTTFTDKALTKAVNFTPILTDEEGNFQSILSPQALQDYAENVLNGVHDDFRHLQVGMEVNAEEFEGSIDKAIEEAGERAEEEHDWQEIFYEAEAAARGFIATENEVIESDEETEESLEDLEKVVDNLAETLGISATELAGLRDRFDDLTLKNFLGQLAEARQKITDTNSVIDNLQGALETASTALEEYNQNGYLTIDTFQSLMGISAQYLTSLINENGQLEINQTTLGNLINKLKQAKIEELQAAETADILAYAQGNVSDMSTLAQQSVTNAGNAAYTAGQNAQAGATGFWTLADALAAANKAANGATVVSDRNIQRIHNSYSKLAKQISEVKVNTTAAGQATTKAGKAASGAGKAAKSAGSAAKQAGKDAEQAAKDAKKAIEEEVKALEKKQQQYERVIKWIEKQYDKQIDKIKKEKDEAIKSIEAQIKAKEKQKDKELDAIEAQIKALDKEKDARKEYWDAQIDALKQSNKEKKDALELQEKLDALEKAKNTKVKVYKEGQGFVYDVDQTAVAQAQKALDEYLSEKAYEDELARLEALRDAELKNYEDRINSLEDYKDKVQENYESQIKNLEAYKEQVEAHYDSQIEMYENYKQQFEDMVNAYEEEQDRLLASQLAGINLENNNWMTRLDNLQNFVNNYHALLRQIEDAKARMDAVSNSTPTNVSSGIVSSGGGGGSYSSGVNQNWNPPTQSTPTKTYTTHADILPTVTKQSVAATKKLNTNSSNWQTYQNMPSYARPHAKGIDTIPNDEIAIVGESPNQEMVIGSKLNGKLMSLDKGTGVVNAESSKSLAGMLNQIGKYSASGFGSGNGTLNNNINNDSLVINGVTIQGANIKDPETFVNGLLSLKSKALQRAYAHK